MGENEVLLQKAWEGLNHLLTTGQINETFINLLYFIKSINEDNLQIGLSDNEVEDLLDEDSVKTELLSVGDGVFEKLQQRLQNLQDSEKVSIFTLKEFPLEEINGPMAKIWEETIKKLSELWED